VPPDFLRRVRQTHVAAPAETGANVAWAQLLKLIHTATTRLSRLPVDRRRRETGQAGSYA